MTKCCDNHNHKNKSKFWWQKDDSIKYEEKCLVRAFFEEQASLPPNQRTNSCMIVCECSSCNRHTL